MVQDDPPPAWTSPPWEHTSNELSSLLLQWAVVESLSPKSLEKECLHIVRALKVFIRQTRGSRNPIAHPLEDRTTVLLDIARGRETSSRLLLVAQELIKLGWLHFPNIYASDEPVEQCMSDVFALLGYNSQQHDVVGKVIEFTKRIARRAILDMEERRHRRHLEVLWSKLSAGLDDMRQSQQVRIHIP